jgi:hypothetical protein
MNAEIRGFENQQRLVHFSHVYRSFAVQFLIRVSPRSSAAKNSLVTSALRA